MSYLASDKQCTVHSSTLWVNEVSHLTVSLGAMIFFKRETNCFRKPAKSLRCLLKLSAQLSRVDNALQLLAPDAPRKEKQLLMERRDRLTNQYEDAKTLRASLDRRGETVLQHLGQLVTDQNVKEYQYFMQMKIKLLIDAKEIEEKLQLGQEQLLALERSASCASSTIES